MSKNLIPVLAKSALALVALFVLMFVVGIAAGYFGAQSDAPPETVQFWILAVSAPFIMVGGLWMGAAWMKSIDEAAQEAHKASWYWGGSAGMAVGMIAIVLAQLPQIETVQFEPIGGRTDPAVYMAAGALGMVGLMLVGYIIVWAWWWLARR